MTDSDAVALAKRGDQNAANELWNRHRPVIFRRCLSDLGCYEDAEDVTQEIFLRIFRKLGNFRGDCEFATWAFTITTNCIRDRFRRNSPSVYLDDIPEPVHDPRLAKATELSQMLKRTPGTEQALLELLIEGYGVKDLANLLDKPQNIVRKRLRLTRKKLKERA